MPRRPKPRRSGLWTGSEGAGRKAARGIVQLSSINGMAHVDLRSRSQASRESASTLDSSRPAAGSRKNPKPGHGLASALNAGA
jgi:hypothetical protein